jgi:hypothetical protein
MGTGHDEYMPDPVLLNLSGLTVSPVNGIEVIASF